MSAIYFAIVSCFAALYFYFSSFWIDLGIQLLDSSGVVVCGAAGDGDGPSHPQAMCDHLQ